MFNHSLPCDDGFDITPDDSNELAQIARGIYVGDIGTSGYIKVDTYEGTTLTFKNVVAGYIIPYRIRKVYDTGTDASSLIGGV